MICEEYFELDSKEKSKKLNQILNTPVLYLNDYFKNVINDVDIYAETILSKKTKNQTDEISKINKTRSIMIDKLTEYENSFRKNLSNLKDRNISKILNDSCSISKEIQQLKKIIFENKWIFFRANKRIKEDQVDFGRLFIVEEIFTDELIKTFNKIGDFENPANFKRFILSKNNNTLCNDYMKLYAISKQISLSLKNPNQAIVQLKQDDIFKIEEIVFERFELSSIDRISLPNQFVNLKILDLSHNKISRLDRNSFSNLPSLKHMNLSFNKLETIESNWFESLANLEQLDVSNNRINSIENEAFSGLINIKDLDLNGNRLANIDSKVLGHLSSLNEIDLSCNNFKKITNFMFNGLTNLEKVYINSNEIENVEENAFYNLVNLKEIQLNMNKIQSIKTKTFDNQLDLLAKIDMRFNEIKHISPDVFNHLKSLRIVLLYGNIDLIHEVDQRDFYRLDENNERINYLTFDGNYYETDEEMDEDDDDESDDEMDYNSDGSDSDDEKDNYDSDY